MDAREAVIDERPASTGYKATVERVRQPGIEILQHGAVEIISNVNETLRRL